MGPPTTFAIHESHDGTFLRLPATVAVALFPALSVAVPATEIDWPALTTSFGVGRRIVS